MTAVTKTSYVLQRYITQLTKSALVKLLIPRSLFCTFEWIKMLDRVFNIMYPLSVQSKFRCQFFIPRVQFSRKKIMNYNLRTRLSRAEMPQFFAPLSTVRERPLPMIMQTSRLQKVQPLVYQHRAANPFSAGPTNLHDSPQSGYDRAGEYTCWSPSLCQKWSLFAQKSWAALHWQLGWTLRSTGNQKSVGERGTRTNMGQFGVWLRVAPLQEVLWPVG